MLKEAHIWAGNEPRTFFNIANALRHRAATRSWCHSLTKHIYCYRIVASVQQGRIIIMTLLQTWISLSATRSYHSYDLVTDMDFTQCNKVVSFYKVPGWTRKTYGRRYNVVALNCFNVCKFMHYCTYDHFWDTTLLHFWDTTLLHWCEELMKSLQTRTLPSLLNGAHRNRDKFLMTWKKLKVFCMLLTTLIILKKIGLSGSK